MPPQLSVVIPAYNEAARIGPYLDEVCAYLSESYPRDHEVVVVDDGSEDGTANLVRAIAARWAWLRLVQLPVNRGKGAAVRTGVLESGGRRILFADADGATPIAEERRLSLAVARGAAVAVGSRQIPGPGVARQRHRRRALAGSFFAWTARTLVGVGVKDTQCGFKMFDGPVGRMLFSAGVEDGYLFDIEVLALAQRWGYAVAEVPVNWSERNGSKVRFVRDSVRMFAGLWRLRSQIRRQAATPTPAAKDRKAA